MEQNNNINHVWDQACKLNLVRGYENDQINYPPSVLELGVNFFILALEELGAKTHFSCEGHPTGFYIAFEAPYPLVVEIAQLTNMGVEVWRENVWTLRNLYDENARSRYTDHDRKEKLRQAANSWMNYFGSRLANTMKQIAVG